MNSIYTGTWLLSNHFHPQVSQAPQDTFKPDNLGSGNGNTVFSFPPLDRIFFHANTELPKPGTIDILSLSVTPPDAKKT
jgi:hypothetical protein